MRKTALVLILVIFFNVILYLIKSGFNRQAYAQNASALQTAMDKTPSQTSAYAFKDDGTVAEKNGGSSLPAFSVIKLWIAAATLNLAEGRSIDLGETVAGKTIDQHLNLMLVESNNESANALIDKIGFDAINSYIQANGYKQTVLNRRMLEDPKIRGDNLTSSRDAAVFMFNLVSKQIASEDYSNKLISILQARTTTKKDFMPEPLSLSKAGFFGKSGTQADAGPIRNNAGTFVDSSGQRVFFAVLVPGANSAEEAIQAIQGIEIAAFSGGPAGTGTIQQNTGIAACKFYRNDQVPGSADCPPSDPASGGFRCEQALDFKSPLLISYIEQASKITGVPAPVLAGLVRIESTVPLQYSATNKSYTISDYTDADIRAMVEFSKTADASNIDTTIGSTNKALCPRSTTGALGITQIQPLNTTGNSEPSVNKGASFLAKLTGTQKDNNTLSYVEYCNPEYSVILAGGFLLGKLGKDSWTTPSDPKAYEELVTTAAGLYYGNDGQTGTYKNSLWRSVEACKNTGTTTTGNLSGSVKSNRLCVKVGNPTDPKPATCSTTPGTSVGGGIITPPVTGPAPTVEAGKLVDAIKEQFGVTMQGAWDEKHLRWTYEKFYELSQTTKFVDYIRGQPVELIGGIPNQESGHVQMSQTGDYANDKDYYLGTLIHEFGHVIYHKPLPENLAGEVNNVYEKVKCLSTYSRCQYDRTENYPEVIAYCLNPKAVGAINQERWPSYRDLAVRILGFCYN